MDLRAIIVAGLPGSGKTYLARRVAIALHFPYLGTDQLRKHLFPEPSYSNREKEMVYDQLRQSMASFLKKGISLVMDGTFYHREWRDAVIAEAEGLGAQVFIIKVWASEEVISDRLSHPRPDSDADISVHEKIKKQSDTWDRPSLMLQSGIKPIEEMVDDALAYVQVL
ncbi:MAG: ATP-binding protein [Saprospiraceae bacterium]|nr:ATP-binding protein [Saprospiraceae bacterium]